ncbi:hypothetical protein J7L13_03730, partial [bacterium]|nr:hypothetical protein [bacterium]
MVEEVFSFLVSLPKRYQLSFFDLKLIEALFVLFSLQEDAKNLKTLNSLLFLRGQFSNCWSENWRTLLFKQEERKKYYSLGTIHYRQQDPRGCAVACLLMALSALKKGKGPSAKEEQRLLRNLSGSRPSPELADIVQEAVREGLSVRIFSEKDYSQEKYEGEWEERRKRYVETLAQLETHPNFSHYTSVKLSSELLLALLQEGNAVLLNGRTEEGVPHAYLVTGYRLQNDHQEFLVSDPLASKKQWMSFEKLNQLASPPKGQWAMALSNFPGSKRETLLSLLNDIFRPLASFSLGRFSENVEDLLRYTNIPYLYLSPSLRPSIPELVKKRIRPALPETLRRGGKVLVFRQKVKKYRQELDPSRISLEDFWTALKEVYRERINLHKRLAFILTGLTYDIFPPAQKAQREEELRDILQKCEEIEPQFFAISSRIKDFVEFWQKHTLSQSGCSEEEQHLFLTPALPSSPLQLRLDLAQNPRALSDPSQGIRLLWRYFNLDPQLLQKYLESHPQVKQPKPPKFNPEEQRRKKFYLLLERKVPGAW